VLSEVEQTVDNVVIINRGTLVRQGSIAELAEHQGHAVLVRSPELDRLAGALPEQTEVERQDATLRIAGMTTEEVGHLAFTERIELHELTTERSDLEDIFLALTGEDGSVEHFGSVANVAEDTAEGTHEGSAR
jgi:ABC-2 type transport system ATP-binding protein